MTGEALTTPTAITAFTSERPEWSCLSDQGSPSSFWGEHQIPSGTLGQATAPSLSLRLHFYKVGL